MARNIKSAKIYKLKPSEGQMTRDDISTWVFTVKAYARQHDWSQFLPGGPNASWTCTDTDENNGLRADDEQATTKLRDDFKDFLATVAANCPTGFTDTVIRESTSFQWIEEKIKTTFNLTTKGENFLDGMNMKLEYDDSFTYQQGWMMIKDKYVASLLPSGHMYMGKALTSKEVISPLASNFLVREWLQSIDARLPDHVRTSRGHLFTPERPTLACNQELLCKQIDHMLQELDGKEISTNNIAVNQPRHVDYLPTTTRGRGYQRYRSSQGPRGPQSSRAGQPRLAPGPPRRGGTQQPARRPAYSCQRCLEARPPRYDASITHATGNCPFTQRQPIGQPQFKVLLVPTSSSAYTQEDSSYHGIETQFVNAPPTAYDQDYQERYQDALVEDNYHHDDQYYESGYIEDLPL